MTAEWRVTEGDAAEELARLPTHAAHTIVTDPPYGIAFMGNAWDTFGAGTAGMRAFQAWTAEWAVEAARTTRPGANWLVFASPRTVHRTACGLEDAGIEIVDCVMWVYGEGFPKTPIQPDGASTRLKPGYEPILLGRTPSPASCRETYERYGTGMLQIGDCLIEGTAGRGHWSADDDTDGTSRPGYDGGWKRGGQRRRGRWPANVLLDESAAKALDAQAGRLRSGGEPHRRKSAKHRGRVYSGRFRGNAISRAPEGAEHGEASRFFYCQKATEEDRQRCADGSDGGPNENPCVKPTSLMRWLVRLTSREGQTVLDPFTGSGTTGVAALVEGRSFLGIERNARDARTARRRLAGKGRSRDDNE